MYTWLETTCNAVEPGFTATALTAASTAGQPADKGAKVIVHMTAIKHGSRGTLDGNGDQRAW